MSGEARPCQRCQQPIPAERLEALPDTRLCVKCSETVGGEYIVRVSSERTSKPGSLKLNYGGVKITKVRRRIKTLEEEASEAEE
jgi:hypothetical protein